MYLLLRHIWSDIKGCQALKIVVDPQGTSIGLAGREIELARVGISFYFAVQPQSMTWALPVMPLAASLQR